MGNVLCLSNVFKQMKMIGIAQCLPKGAAAASVEKVGEVFTSEGRLADSSAAGSQAASCLICS